MKISYAITVCNEFIEIQRLISFLLQRKRSEDQIVVLFDEANGDPEIEQYLRTHSINSEFVWHKGAFDRHFADWKNKLTNYCTGDYIFQIDADEMPVDSLIENLPSILEANPDVDVYIVPRINTVVGLTADHIQRWGWNLNENGFINFPDYQWRIYKNKPEIVWINKVHERLNGYKQFAALPAEVDFCLEHHKTIAKQEKQNELYAKL
jgi:hypothetical protein